MFSVFTGAVYFAAREFLSHFALQYWIVAKVFSARAQHRYILVELECKKCNGGHTVLYDAITKMKRRRFGYYTKPTCMKIQVSTAKRTYEFIDAVIPLF
jgi:hypothetical protein